MFVHDHEGFIDDLHFNVDVQVFTGYAPSSEKATMGPDGRRFTVHHGLGQQLHQRFGVVDHTIIAPGGEENLIEGFLYVSVFKNLAYALNEPLERQDTVPP